MVVGNVYTDQLGSDEEFICRKEPTELVLMASAVSGYTPELDVEPEYTRHPALPQHGHCATMRGLVVDTV
jgi:hypothetical protein